MTQYLIILARSVKNIIRGTCFVHCCLLLNHPKIHGVIFIFISISYTSFRSWTACTILTASITVFPVCIPDSERSQTTRKIYEKIRIVSVNLAYVWNKRSIIRGVKQAHRAGEYHGVWYESDSRHWQFIRDIPIKVHQNITKVQSPSAYAHAH